MPGLSGLMDYGFSDLAFTPLLPNQFGAGFAATGPMYDGVGCEGAPIARIFGPSQPGAGYSGPPRGSAPHPTNLVFAASWVNIRVQVPPSRPDLRFLAEQHVVGLRLGPGKWSVSGGRLFPGEKSKRADGQLRTDPVMRQGTAYVQAPTTWRYADVYNISGVVYQDTGTGVFLADDGRFLNITHPG
ncbi:MAG: hypothetical protein Q9219_004360 [cf. Caloplaca sp. 3 TL-2023]